MGETQKDNMQQTSTAGFKHHQMSKMHTTKSRSIHPTKSCFFCFFKFWQTLLGLIVMYYQTQTKWIILCKTPNNSTCRNWACCVDLFSWWVKQSSPYPEDCLKKSYTSSLSHYSQLCNRQHKESLKLGGKKFAWLSFLMSNCAEGQKSRLDYWPNSIELVCTHKGQFENCDQLLLTSPFGSAFLPAPSPSLSPPALFDLLSSSCPFPHHNLPPPSFLSHSG